MISGRASLNDPLYGPIDLTDQEIALVNTPAFHRLHHLRQLGFTFLALPSATASRFEHSIGVMRNATLVARELQAEEEVTLKSGDLETLRAAALLHDIGHGPFSHFFEKVLHLLGTKVNQASVSAEIIRNDAAVRSALNEAKLDYVRVADIVAPEKIDKISGIDLLFARIISGDVDADRIDYLRRDCFFSGLPQSIDAERTLKGLTYRRLDMYPSSREELFLREEAVELADALLMARLSLRQNVWTNPINRAAESLVFKALQIATQEGSKGCALRGLEGASLMAKFQIWTDDDLLGELIRAGGQSAKIVMGLLRHKLFASKQRFRFKELNPEIKGSLQSIDKKSKEDRVVELHKMEIEFAQIIADETKLPPESILVDFPELGSLQETKQKVLLHNGSYAPLSERSSFAARISELFRDYYVAHVFVIDGAPNPDQSDTIQKIMSAPGLKQ